MLSLSKFSHCSKPYLYSILAAAVLSSTTALASSATASLDIKLIPTKHHINMAAEKIIPLVKQYIDVNLYRQVKAQVIYNNKQNPDHVLVYLFSKKYHKMEIARIDINSRLQALSFTKNYKLTATDYAQQPGIRASEAKCPDTSIQFIAFAPNDDDFEQNITKGVADAADSHGLKTIRLLKDDATHDNYLNYMSCPKLIGNFYDGDSNPDDIATADGMIQASEISAVLKNQFKYKVTNIWLACEAFNNPMKTTMLDSVQSQKYAAGINDLLVGPSDETAACAIKDDMNGKPMTATFKACVDAHDNPEDRWGFDGNGSDYFGM